MNLLQRYQGCLLGLAVGDAIGTTVEFADRGTFEALTDMVGGGPFGLKPGQWTDDTSMALCLAHSLLACKGFDADDQMRRYCDWRNDGYMSSTGRCFDIGATVSEALVLYQQTGEPFSGSTHPFAAGNGSLMRLAPVAMFYSPDEEVLIHFAGESSRTTHGAKECVDACRYFASLLHECFLGKPKSEVLASTLYAPTTKKVRSIASEAYLDKSEAEIRGTGYVVESLEAALWCFATTESFDQAILKAANLGDDADTTAAVCGQIAGAYYGIDGIRRDWTQRITLSTEMMDWASALYRASGHGKE